MVISVKKGAGDLLRQSKRDGPSEEDSRPRWDNEDNCGFHPPQATLTPPPPPSHLTIPSPPSLITWST